jgi:hypothetical protein
MSRRARQIECDEQAIGHLLEIENSRVLPAGLVQRVKIVSGCIKGESIKNLAKKFAVSRSTIIHWKNRFVEFGLDGLRVTELIRVPCNYGQPLHSQEALGMA